MPSHPEDNQNKAKAKTDKIDDDDDDDDSSHPSSSSSAPTAEAEVADTEAAALEESPVKTAAAATTATTTPSSPSDLISSVVRAHLQRSAAAAAAAAVAASERSASPTPPTDDAAVANKKVAMKTEKQEEEEEQEQGNEDEQRANSPPEPQQATAILESANGDGIIDKDGGVRSFVLPKDFEPTAVHVLCGRRKGHKDFGGNWPGNLALESLIVAHLPQYEASGNRTVEKIALVNKVLSIIRERGGRFVRRAILQDDAKKSQQLWMEVGDMNARKDIHAIFKVFAKARLIQRQSAATAAYAAPAAATAVPVTASPLEHLHPASHHHQAVLQAAQRAEAQAQQLQQQQQQQQQQHNFPKLPPPPKTAEYFQSRGMSQADARQAAAMETMKHAAHVAAAKHKANLAKRQSEDVAAARRAADEKQAAALAATKQQAAAAVAKQALAAAAQRQAESAVVAMAGSSAEKGSAQWPLPTRLYKVDEAAARRESLERATMVRKRSKPESIEELQHNGGTAGMERRASERMQKRRSVDEDMAVDALQLIAQASAATTVAGASATADDPTTHSSPTVRRRSSVQAKSVGRASFSKEPVDAPKSQVRCCCLQLAPRSARETPWDATQRALACLTSVALQEPDVDLFVLPELCPVGSSQDTFTKYLPLSQEWQNLYKRIDQAFSDQAKDLGVYIVYGTIGWRRRELDRSLKFTLQHKVVDRKGEVVAVYDKSYLSDMEFRFFERGARTSNTFMLDGFSFGILLGDDLKYPNLARGLARDHDADVLLHPSADPTPRYFRQCRAVENCVYVLGVEYSNGATVAVPPDPEHEPIGIDSPEGDAEDEEGYLLTRIQRAAAEFARTNFPYYRYMKTEPRNAS